MDRLKSEIIFKSNFLLLWALLAFQAGFLNSIGFLACGRFVSHVTGFGSQAGISLAHGQYFFAAIALSAPACFILGGFVSGMLTAARIATQRMPRYDLVVTLIPILILVALGGGVSGFFGGFDNEPYAPHDFVFLSLLSFICGLQNACFSTLTNGTVRTTHLTGLSSDAGSDLAVLHFGYLRGEARTSLLRKNGMRASVFMGFAIGAFISAVVDHHLAFQSLLIPLLTSVGVALVFFRISSAFSSPTGSLLNSKPNPNRSPQF